jgi:hypothetical protein
MNIEFLEQIFFGNSLRNYLYFSSILLFGLLFKRVFSKLLNRLMFLLFKRIEPDTEPKVFIEMLLKPVEFLIILIVIYLSINQLDYPLNEVIFRRTSLIDNVPTLYELKVVQVVDKLILLLFIISAFWILLRIIDFIAHVFKYKALFSLSKSDDQMVPFIKELSKIITVIFAFFVILGTVFNLNVATIIAGLGIGGIAVALAADGTAAAATAAAATAAVAIAVVANAAAANASRRAATAAAVGIQVGRRASRARVDYSIPTLTCRTDRHVGAGQRTACVLSFKTSQGRTEPSQDPH